MTEATERIYVIPLRKEWLKSARVGRANRSVNTVKSFLARHMHAEDVQISRGINDALWARGAKKPPGRIKVKAKKDGETVMATLPDEKIERPEAKEKKPETPMEKVKGMLKPAAAKEEPKHEKKAEGREEKPGHGPERKAETKEAKAIPGKVNKSKNKK
jgi:large subunit ribosomal protein L31e